MFLGLPLFKGLHLFWTQEYLVNVQTMRQIAQICVALSKKLNFTGKNTIASNVSQFCTQLLIKKLKPGKMVAAKKHRKYFNTPILLKVPSLARKFHIKFHINFHIKFYIKFHINFHDNFHINIKKY